MNPATQWGWNEIFQNKMVYLLETLTWQNATPTRPGERAKHMSQKPVLFKPDFMPGKSAESDIKKDTVAADVDTIKELLARPRK